jgi:ATP-binding cassette subfamily F protein uup
VKPYPGGYEDYFRQRKVILPPQPAEQKGAAQKKEPVDQTQKKKLSFNEKRELEALPAKIEELEGEIAAIEADLVAARIYTSERLSVAQAELEAAVERWAELEERA